MKLRIISLFVLAAGLALFAPSSARADFAPHSVSHVPTYGRLPR